MKPLVSVIVPTKNSSQFLSACLKTIKNQSYKNIELIVVDNSSSDDTKAIAKKYTSKVFNKGPERSAQRNFGATKSKGRYLLFIDSDMELSKYVVKQCVQMAQKTNTKAVIIPEESFGQGFWAQCKKLERSFYVDVDWMEAARFFEARLYKKVGGFNEQMISGEDWDLSQRVIKLTSIDRIENYIFHNEGKLSLRRSIEKKYYYAQKLQEYVFIDTNRKNFSKQSSPLRRLFLFFSHPIVLFRNPVLGFGMLFMKFAEFGAGGLGYSISLIKKSDE